VRLSISTMANMGAPFLVTTYSSRSFSTTVKISLMRPSASSSVRIWLSSTWSIGGSYRLISYSIARISSRVKHILLSLIQSLTTFMQHTVLKHTLPNGISLILIPLLNTEAVTTIVLMGVGSRYESDAQQGLAHFTEHMVFKGGKKYKTAQSIAQSLDAVGGEFNAFTSHEFTGFYTKTAAQHMELGIDVLSDMALHASFPEEELEKEKGVIVEEINMYEDMPMRKVDHVLSRLVYGDTGLGRPILGTKQSVTAFTRKDFLHYREQFYKGMQCTIVVAGAIQEESAQALIWKYFGELPKGEEYTPPPARFLSSSKKVLVEVKDSQQSHLMLSTPGYDLTHPRRHAFRVLSTILGGNMSSRLFTSVREQQGLCYYVRAVPDTYVDSGLLVASAGVDNARLHQAISAIVAQFGLLRNELVGPEELDRAKQFLLGKMLLGLEDSEQVAEFYGMQELLEKQEESPEQIAERVLEVTAEQVREVAQELFTEAQMRLAVVGPQQDEAALEALLKM
jgi:predicted Zn-dependent peptidase